MRNVVVSTTLFVSAVVLFAALLLIVFTKSPDANTENTRQTNVASEYCIEQEGEHVIRTSEYGQYGVCVFADGSECDEWEYYRGQCQPQSAPFIRL